MSKEYIEREAFDNALCEAMKKHNPYDSCESKIMSGLLEAQELLDEIPAADVVEVVRCKDCKRARKMNVRESEVFVDGCVMCDKTDINGSEHPMLPDDFCSYGERKEINNDT